MGNKIKYKTKESKGIIVGYIKNRIKRNKNFLCAITGGTGSGKSYSALRLAELLDPNFTPSNVIYTPIQFMNLINSGKLKKGAVIIFDEAGVGINARKWQSVGNNLIQFVLQTFRNDNYIVFFTAPDFSFIDGASRKLFHAQFETKDIVFSRSVCNLKPFMIQINQRKGTMYYKYLIATIPNIGEVKVNNLEVALPSKDLVNAYETMKNYYTRKLKDKVQKKLNYNENKDKDKLPELTKRQKEVYDLLKEHHLRDLPKEMNISIQGVYDHIKAIKRKGYVVKTNNETKQKEKS